MEVDPESRKRKQSGASSGVSPTLKKVNSMPDFSLTASGDTSSKSCASFMNNVATVFENETFVDRIAPSLHKLMAPVITLAINEAVTKAVTQIEKDVIKPLQDQNKKLNLKVKESEEIIRSKDELLAQKNDQISKLQSDVSKLTKSTSKLTDKLDDLEQYGRRNSVRMYNVNCALYGNNCLDAVVDVLHSKLKVSVGPDDIDRCHPVGKPNANGFKPIIVKFKSYNAKREVYSSKSNLKGNPDKIFITENLTKQNHKIVATLLTKVKAKNIHSFWTIDGKIFFKSDADAGPERVLRNSDVAEPLPGTDETETFDSY